MEIPNHFPFVELGEFVVMPNHAHGIIVIDKPDDGCDDGVVGRIVETQNFASLLREQPEQPKPKKQIWTTIKKFGINNSGV